MLQRWRGGGIGDRHNSLRYGGYISWRGVTARPLDVAGVVRETWGRT